VVLELDREIKVLDKGFVRLIDRMGRDESIVQAARVSYGKGTKSTSEDRGLIRYLMRNSHTSPFEMIQTKWHIKTPIFIARQWLRHRTASVNEMSLRYSEATDEFYVPSEDRIQSQSKNNKQGSGEALDNTIQAQFFDELESIHSTAFKSYEQLNNLGVARELSRILLPVSLYTEFYWSMNLRNLFHFLKLRLDAHAQYEIRVYAEAIFSIIKEIFPMASEAFEDYILNAKMFSKGEWEVLKQLMRPGAKPEEIEGYNNLSAGERKELLFKLGEEYA